MDWVDRVLEAMGFGLIFSGWMATLHRGALASFLLFNIYSVVAILFSIRQGDPLAALLFIIYLEPFLVRLEAVLSGLRVANIREAYMDNVQALGDDLQDILRVDPNLPRFRGCLWSPPQPKLEVYHHWPQFLGRPPQLASKVAPCL